MTDGPLAGRTAVVSGASRGIGAAIARALDAAGARVALVARTKRALDDIAADLGNAPVVVAADLGTVEGPAAAAAAATEVFGGRIDVLVNNAAVAIRKPSEELTPEEVQHVLD